MKNLKRLSLFLISIILLNACNDKDTPASSLFHPDLVNKSPKLENTSYTVLFNPANGCQYVYNTSINSSIEQEVKGEEVESSTKNELTTLYHIEKDSSGNTTIKITYRKFKAKVKVGDDEKEIDAATAANALDPHEKIFAAFNGASFHALFNKNGEIKQIKGLEDISNNMYSFADGNPSAIQVIQSSARQFLSDEIIKSNMEQQFNIFPSYAVKIGESWQRNAMVSADMKVTFPVTYKLINVESGVATIDVKGKVQIDNQQTETGGYKVNLTLDGKQQGETKVDIKTGMVLNSKLKMTAKGNLQMGGIDVPIKLKTDNNIVGKKVR